MGSGSPSGRPAPSTTSRSPSGRHRPRLRRRERCRQVHARQDHRRRLPAGSGRPGPARDDRSRSALPAQALVRGIALVAQEVALVPRLTVAENVFLGAEPRRAGFIDRGSLRERFDRLVADAGLRPPGGVRRRAPAARRSSSRSRSCARSPATPTSSSSTSRRRACRPMEVERLHEIVRGAADAGPHGHPRLALPDRGPRPVRRRHRPARRPRRPDGPDRRRDRGEPRDRDARPAGRPRLPGEAARRRPTPRSSSPSRA